MSARWGRYVDLGRFAVMPAILLTATSLAGCVTESPAAGGGPGDFKALVARGELKSPRPAAISLASIEGAPDPVIARFRQVIATEATDRDIVVADPGSARYFVRGYLDAYPTESGTAVRYVWDVYDSQKQHTQRLGDGVNIPGIVTDPWSAVDDKVLSSIASRSADDIATYLSGTPEVTGASPAAVVDAASPPPTEAN